MSRADALRAFAEAYTRRMPEDEAPTIDADTFADAVETCEANQVPDATARLTQLIETVIDQWLDGTEGASVMGAANVLDAMAAELLAREA